MFPEPIDFRIAKLSDTSTVFWLNQHWCKAYEEGFKENGFLINPFSISQVQGLIESREVVVGDFLGKIVGYYLSNSLYENDDIRKRRQILAELIANNQLNDARYVCHTQVAIDPDFMRKGISKNLLKELKKLVFDRFDYLAGIVYKENLNGKKAALKSGWKVACETEAGILVVTPTKEY